MPSRFVQRCHLLWQRRALRQSPYQFIRLSTCQRPLSSRDRTRRPHKQSTCILGPVPCATRRLAKPPLSARTPWQSECGLTPRSSGAPTAGHQARVGGTVYIFTAPGLASYRCRPLSSNVRPHTTRPVASPRNDSNRQNSIRPRWRNHDAVQLRL